MITTLQRFSTNIDIIQEIPTVFFREIETATAFGDHLFPQWADGVFRNTALKTKFEAVYVKYKSIKSKKMRGKISLAFAQNNRIEDLCNVHVGTEIIKLTDLPKSIQKSIDTLFLYLYTTSINYHEFASHVNDNIKDSIDRFILANQLEVCPLCGLEGFLNLEGQARIALDHWLCKDLFPFSAVNFDNLVPIGSNCNARPAKGTKNILFDATTNTRIKAYYPYALHSGISTSFSYVNEPNINPIQDQDWSFAIMPNDPNETDIFQSWNSTLNITTRYKDFIKKNILKMWEERYKKFILNNHQLEHAQNINELRNNFKHWRAAFDIKTVPASVVYISFINYLINHASDKYLYGLCENFKRTI